MPLFDRPCSQSLCGFSFGTNRPQRSQRIGQWAGTTPATPFRVKTAIPPSGNAFEPLSLGLFVEFGAVCGIVTVGDPVIEGFASNSLPQARIPVFLGPFVELCMIRGPALAGVA